MKRFINLYFLVLVSTWVDAASAQASSELLSGNYLFQIIGSLGLVICVLLGVLMFLKRFNSVGKANGEHIQILGSAALGQRERAVLLQVGGDQILIGVASGNVTALHHLSENVSVTDTEGSLSFKDVWSFAQRAQRSQI